MGSMASDIKIAYKMHMLCIYTVLTINPDSMFESRRNSQLGAENHFSTSSSPQELTVTRAELEAIRRMCQRRSNM